METMNNEVENRGAEETKLYAGKYKSVEELEKAYKNSAKIFNENKVLQEKLKSFAVPESYQLPESIALSEQEMQGLVSTAKQVGLNQTQFEKTLATMQDQQQNYQMQLAERKKQLGEQFKVLEDYVTKTYPSALHHTVLNTLLGDDNAMNDALKHRDQLLNTQVPGLNNQRVNLSDPYEGRTEMLNLKWRMSIVKIPLSRTENVMLILLMKLLRQRSRPINFFLIISSYYLNFI